MNLMSNVSMLNSRNINLIDQYFPMLRPYVMNPILKQIEELMDQYFGHVFEKITDEQKQKVAIVVLEPIIRNAMMAGFGNFIFPNYKQDQSLKISIDMLTTERMAMCLYLWGILSGSSYKSEISNENSVLVQTNRIFSSQKIQHPIFNKVEVFLKNLGQNSLWFGKEDLWHSAEERLTMQGNTLVSIDDKKYYIQDRQNEHIYRIRYQNGENLSLSAANQLRYHANNISETFVQTITYRFLGMLACCGLLNNNLESTMTQLVLLQINLKNTLRSSVKTKYTTPDLTRSDKAYKQIRHAETSG